MSLVANCEPARTALIASTTQTSEADAPNSSVHRPPTPKTATLLAYDAPWLLWWSGHEGMHILQNESDLSLRALPHVEPMYLRAAVLEDGTVVHSSGAAITWIRADQTVKSENLALCGFPTSVLQVFSDGLVVHCHERTQGKQGTFGSVFFVPIRDGALDVDARFLLLDDARHFRVHGFARANELLAATNDGRLYIYNLDDRSVQSLRVSGIDVLGLDDGVAIVGGDGVYNISGGEKLACRLPLCRHGIIAVRNGFVYYWRIVPIARAQVFELHVADTNRCETLHPTVWAIRAGRSGNILGRHGPDDVVHFHPTRETQDALLIWTGEEWASVPWFERRKP